MAIRGIRIPTRDEMKKKIQHALTQLEKDGISSEQISFQMGVKFFAVQSWKSGRRVPKLPTIHQLEHMYGVKIL